jgi:hypothetical protein
MARSERSKESNVSWCLPTGSKCEWVEIEPFVQFFNSLAGTSYSRVTCLDVLDRSMKQPEVLLRSIDGSCAVIERKNVVWPSDSLQRHASEHAFFQGVADEIGSLFSDDTYELVVTDSYLHVGKRRMSKIVGDLRDQLILAKRASASSAWEWISHPIPCRLRRVPEFERDIDFPSNGLMVRIELTEWNYNNGIDYAAIEAGVALQRVATGLIIPPSLSDEVILVEVG